MHSNLKSLTAHFTGLLKNKLLKFNELPAKFNLLRVYPSGSRAWQRGPIREQASALRVGRFRGEYEEERTIGSAITTSAHPN